MYNQGNIDAATRLSNRNSELEQRVNYLEARIIRLEDTLLMCLLRNDFTCFYCGNKAKYVVNGRIVCYHHTSRSERDV